MPGLGDHWVPPVGLALVRLAWVCVNVGDDGERFRPANLPQACECVAAEHADSASVGARVEFIVEDNLASDQLLALDDAENEASRLVLLSSAHPKFPHTAEPKSSSDFESHYVPLNPL
jgi:hypothetical protein